MVTQKYLEYKHRTQSAYFMDQNVVYFCNKKQSTYHCLMQVPLDRCLYHPRAYLWEGHAIILLYSLEHQTKRISGSTFKSKPLIFLSQDILFLILHSKCSETDLNWNCWHQDILNVGIGFLHLFSSGFLVQTLVLHGTENTYQMETSLYVGNVVKIQDCREYLVRSAVKQSCLLLLLQWSFSGNAMFSVG